MLKDGITEALADGDIQAVKAALARGADLDARDAEGRTPLGIALRSGFPTITRLLLEAGARPEGGWAEVAGFTRSFPGSADALGDIVSAILAHGTGAAPMPSDGDDDHVRAVLALLDVAGPAPATVVTAMRRLEPTFRRRAFEAAIERGDEATVLALAGRPGVDPSLGLRLATARGHLGLVQRFLALGADVDKQDGVRGAPLHIAASEGRLDLVEVLLAAGADADLWSVPEGQDEQRTPLIDAVGAGHADVVRRLVAAGARVDLAADDERYLVDPESRPLHRARDVPVLRVLLDAGADPNLELEVPDDAWLADTDEPPATPLVAAVEQGELEVARLLHERGARFHGDRRRPSEVAVAIERGDGAMLAWLLERGARPHDEEKLPRVADDTIRALCAAAGVKVVAPPRRKPRPWKETDTVESLVRERREDDALRLLLDGTAPDRSRRAHPGTLGEAAERGMARLVRALLERGADANRPDEHRHSPLRRAFWSANTRFITIPDALVTMDALVEAGAKLGDEPFDFASSGAAWAIRWLAERGRLDVSRSWRRRGTMLHAAAARGHVEVARMVLDAGAAVEAVSDDPFVRGATPLLVAARGDHVAVMKLLVERGANLHHRTPDGEDALSFAANAPAASKLLRDLGVRSGPREH